MAWSAYDNNAMANGNNEFIKNFLNSFIQAKMQGSQRDFESQQKDKEFANQQALKNSEFANQKEIKAGDYASQKELEGLRQSGQMSLEEKKLAAEGDWKNKELAQKGEQFKGELGYKNRTADISERELGLKGEQYANLNNLEKEKLKIDSLKNKGLLSQAQADNATKMAIAELSANKQSNKEPSSDQFKAASFARSAKQAEQIFSDLDKSGYDPSSIKSQAERSSFYPERFVSGETKSQVQAEKNFINAVLRRDSGASISDGEREDAAKQYFAREGDTPEVKKQKELNRAQKIASLEAEGGNALERIPMISAQGLIPNGNKTASQGLLQNTAVAEPSGPSQQDAQAIQWAKQNPQDPRAQKILQMNGAK